jgi:oligopeptide/dipeptide ABC transporter ATP-binding protein
MQIVFQDPHSSLNPRMTVGEALHEPSAFHRVAAEGELDAYVGGLLDMVGLPADARTKYPHELSGGQRQRVGIARALSVKPELVVLDEPVSALDVSIQAQVLNLLQDLRERLSLTYVLISHDLGVVRCFADRVLVMYLGRIVEEVPAASLSAAKHPYTEALLRAVPKLGGGRREAPLLEGEPPSPYGVRRGCVFADRCPKVEPACREERPELVAIGEGHRVACPVVIAGR